jgi:membrane-associated phospholipid phosphatase
MKKRIEKLIPYYGVVPLVLALTVNMAVYMGARLIAGGWHHYNMESWLDRRIPFWSPSVVIYLGCYLFWIVNYILMVRQEKEEVCKFFVGDLLSRLVCLFFFCALPTTNVRPEVADQGFWNRVMLFVYHIDAADNLFPSIHCLVSWFCYIGLRGRKDIPGWYRKASCIMAVLVCVSTLTTKQHVIPDVLAGILLAEACRYLGKKPFLWKPYEKFLDAVNERLFRNRKGGTLCQERKQLET